jgi:WD40 repeat protein
MAVGGQEPTVKIWEYNDMSRRWVQIETLDGHKDSIHDISWAPMSGRSHHLIATASKDKKVKIWKFQNLKEPKAEAVASLEGHKSEVNTSVFLFYFSISLFLYYFLQFSTILSIKFHVLFYIFCSRCRFICTIYGRKIVIYCSKIRTGMESRVEYFGNDSGIIW